MDKKPIATKIELYKHRDQVKFTEGNVTIVHYELLNKETLKDINRKNALVVIPVSLMEVHGTFLPLGTDLLESIGWGNFVVPDALKNRRSEKKYIIVLFHPVPLGTGGIRGMKGTVNINRKTFRDAILDIVDGLVYAGFRKFFIPTAHHGNTHSTCIEEVVHII
ncbi:MAG: hypothetical protein GF364_12710, partial [Candidatus Lokiarchaeota archaeon]|nr:hypothetical protein [Candidatus Lokiarchaeota archaeon]